MTEALTERQAEVLAIIRDYIQVNGIAPTHPPSLPGPLASVRPGRPPTT